MADMSFGEAVTSVFSKYATFSGRARRAEYWWFYLFSCLASVALELVEGAIGGWSLNSPGVLSGIFALATFLPTVAVWFRRLHDVGRSAWWSLLIFVPVVGWIILIYWSVRRGDVGTNRFGPDPIDGDEPYSPSVIPRVPRQ